MSPCQKPVLTPVIPHQGSGNWLAITLLYFGLHNSPDPISADCFPGNRELELHQDSNEILLVVKRPNRANLCVNKHELVRSKPWQCQSDHEKTGFVLFIAQDLPVHANYTNHMHKFANPFANRTWKGLLICHKYH